MDRERERVGLVPGVRETDRTVEVAVRVHLDDPEAGVLLVIGAEAAIERASVPYLRLRLERVGPRLVEAEGVRIHVGVAVDERFESTVLHTSFAQEDLAFTDIYLGLDDDLADRTDALGQLDEHLIAVRSHARPIADHDASPDISPQADPGTS